MPRKSYPGDVSDEEWAFAAPYLTLMREDAPQRRHDLRGLFDGLRYAVRTGCQWRYLPGDLPPWEAVYQQARRWMAARVFSAMAADLRALLRLLRDRAERPTAACIDSRTLQGTPESGGRGGYDGYKRKKGSKVHLAVDTLGHLLALVVTPADVGDREVVAELAARVRDASEARVEVAFVDQGYTGERAAADAGAAGIELVVVKLPVAKRGFVLLPKRWVVERSFAWATRFRRLARDHERLATVLCGLHVLAFAVLMLRQFSLLMPCSSA